MKPIYNNVFFLAGQNSYLVDKPITIGYLEDHHTTRTIMRAILSQHGFVFHSEASNGRDFLEQLAKADTLPDVCLLDLSMPVMNGFETAIVLREKYPAIRILAYSTNDYTDVVEAALKCGAHGFISKDSDPIEFKAGLLAVFAGQPFIRQNKSSVANCGREATYTTSDKVKTISVIQ